ncbi:MAG: hypothetical protein H6860_05730 [Rhodospirillales bacterium]|nr:hypothetical protein [Alphaproteobacteria bacterium]MCB9981879.1 hypothetical protein [Rhodospirillales bacterium]
MKKFVMRTHLILSISLIILTTLVSVAYATTLLSHSPVQLHILTAENIPKNKGLTIKKKSGRYSINGLEISNYADIHNRYGLRVSCLKKCRKNLESIMFKSDNKNIFFCDYESIVMSSVVDSVTSKKILPQCWKEKKFTTSEPTSITIQYKGAENIRDKVNDKKLSVLLDTFNVFINTGSSQILLKGELLYKGNKEKFSVFEQERMPKRKNKIHYPIQKMEDALERARQEELDEILSNLQKQYKPDRIFATVELIYLDESYRQDPDSYLWQVKVGAYDYLPEKKRERLTPPYVDSLETCEAIFDQEGKAVKLDFWSCERTWHGWFKGLFGD